MPDLKILASHPVQYHVPFFREIHAAGLDIEVGYTHQGTAGRVARDAEFGIDFAWDLDLLSGYPYRIFNQGLEKYRGSRQIRFAYRLLLWALQDRNTPLLLVGWFTELIWLTWLLRILSRAPTIVMSETTPLSFASTPKPRWRILLLRWLLQHTTANLFVGTQNQNFLRDMGVPDEQLFHIPYSIDNIRFAAEVNRLLPKRDELCHTYGLNPHLATFLFCGKLIPKKRPLQLLEAYVSAQLVNQAQLIYVGDGELRSELEQRIQTLGLKHVHLVGFLNQSQMPLAYVLGEVLCLISEGTETWGLVVNEALACGRPVIISDTVGCGPDLVAPGNGWITPLDDPNKLAETLIHAFKQHEAWNEMGELGRKNVARNTFSVMAGGVISALQFIRGT